MGSISLYKKLKLFSLYRKTIKNNSDELSRVFNIKIDNAKRLYTVINIPEEAIGEAYDLKTSDINVISGNYIRDYSNNLFNYLLSKGLSELVSFYNTEKVGKRSYLLIYGFKLINTDVLYKRLYITGLISFFIILISLIII